MSFQKTFQYDFEDFKKENFKLAGIYYQHKFWDYLQKYSIQI